MTERTCSKCGSSGPFYDGHSSCVECVKRQAANWRRSNPKRARNVRDRRSRIRKYGLTLTSYEALLEHQDRSCFICGVRPDDERALCVDHCHETQEVRGLLCDRCNRGLGAFKDDPAMLAKAVDYLNNPPARERLTGLPAYQYSPSPASGEQLGLLGEAA